MLSKKDIIRINQEFHTGKLANESSLDYALDNARKTKDWIKAAAYLVRAILIDHAFEDGNKRTAAAVLVAYFDINNVYYEEYKVGKAVLQIMKKNIIDIRKIARSIQNVIE
jgi:prophage maintenance system killer protein